MAGVLVELPGVPHGKGRPRFARRGNFVMAYTPAKTRTYESMLQGAAIEAMNGRPPLEGPLRVEVEAVFPVPQSWPQKRKAAALIGLVRPTSRPDWENLAKTLDAFNAVVWRDDAQVVRGTIEKRYGEVPHLRVEVFTV
jgi:Holliday junction resolvase RusA-like endonuclease